MTDFYAKFMADDAVEPSSVDLAESRGGNVGGGDDEGEHHHYGLDVEHELITRKEDGVRILLVHTEMPGAISHVQVDVSVGDDYEVRPEQRECAHFIEHLVASLLRSRTYPDAGNKRAAEELGISSNACTSAVRTSYYMNGSTDLLKQMIDFQVGAIVDFLRYFAGGDDPRYAREEMAVRRELSSKVDMAEMRLYERLNEILYPGHPRAVSQRQDMRNIMTMTPATVRNFYARHYVPSNMVFIVATSETRERVLQLLGEYTFKEPAAIRAQAPLRPRLQRAPFPTPSQVYYEELKQARTVRLNMVWPLNMRRYDPGAADVSVIENVLTGGFSSRLLHRLREVDGDVYSVSAYACLDPLDASFSNFQIETSTSAEKVEEVITHILDELQRLCSNDDPSELGEEIAKYRRRIASARERGYLNRAPTVYVDAYAEQVLYRWKVVRSREDSLRHMETIQPGQVVDACRRIFGSRGILLYGAASQLPQLTERTLAALLRQHEGPPPLTPARTDASTILASPW